MPSARRTDPALWEAVKARVTADSRGGRPGQWSARKAQLAVKLYKEAGGGYIGPKDPANSLTRWTRQDWRTGSGRPSLETGERYLPAAAIEALSPAEYAATTRAKRAGMARGQQFVPQPRKIAAKAAKYRRNGEMDYLYHATHLGKVIDGIAEEGLEPSGGSQFNPGYDAHSRGRIFLCSEDGLRYWLNKMKMLAEYHSELSTTDAVIYWTPVALRVMKDRAGTLGADWPGSSDSRAGSYFTTENIAPEDIEIWDGFGWTALPDAEEALTEMAEDAEKGAEYEEGDGAEWYNPNYELFHPPEAA